MGKRTYKKAYNRVEMMEKVYNSWKILKPLRTEDKIVYYLAQCLECEREYEVDGRNVRLGLSKRCRPCGKAASAKVRTGKMRKGIDPKTYSFSRILKQYKSGAKNRDLDFKLADDVFLDMLTKDCHYCNAAPSTTCNPMKGMKVSEEKYNLGWITYNGVDRIDSDKGYEEGNVVTCCQKCNMAKSDWTTEEFEAWALRLAETIKNRKAA